MVTLFIIFWRYFTILYRVIATPTLVAKCKNFLYLKWTKKEDLFFDCTIIPFLTGWFRLIKTLNLTNQPHLFPSWFSDKKVPTLWPNRMVVFLFLAFSGRSYAIIQKGVQQISMVEGCSSLIISFKIEIKRSKCQGWFSITLYLSFREANSNIKRLFPSSCILIPFLGLHTPRSYS